VISEVAGEERLDELCRMLGAAPADTAARAHAAQLLAAAGAAV
jgi:DNA repair ATPase RecN